MPGARMRLPTRPQRPCVLSNRRLRLLVLPPRRCYSQPPAPPIPINTRPPDARLPYDRRPRKGWAPPRTIAVLGGGLTGLVTAYRLAKLLPKTKITLYEASSRLGGWVDTEEIKDDQGRTILFERGARMVQIPREGSSKFDDVPFYHLIEELKLGDQVVGIARGTPMPSYIYYPDHLVQMPMPGPKTTYAGWFSILNSLRTEPIFRNLGSWLVHAVGTRKSETIYDLSHQKLDEGNLTVNLALPSYSLGVYYTRVFGDRAPVDNILSAMMHGIFGGDVWKLSIMRDPFGMAISRWRLPDGFEEYTTVDRGSADAAQFLTNPGEDDVLGQEWLGFSHMWFRDGFETLPRALAAALEKCDNVTIKTGSPVSSVRLSSARNGISVTDNKGVQFYDHAVSTLFAGTLASVTHGRLPSLAEFPAVTIQAVNLWYPTQGLNHPRMGAGYLIPQSVKHELNPEKALGVLFDSDRDLLRFRKPTEGPPPNLGTTFTVLLGGHHWDGIPADQLPTPEQAGRLAKAVVARHLGISDEHNAQAIVSTKLCRECIPQHLVNHWPRMETARHELDANFARHLSVVGPSYQMPGVFGSITAAYDLANFLAGKYPALHVKTGHFPVGPTGLSRFQKSRDAYFARKAELPLRFPEHIRRRPDSLWTRPMAWARKQGARVLRTMYHLQILNEHVKAAEKLQEETARLKVARGRQEREYEGREKELLEKLVKEVRQLKESRVACERQAATFDAAIRADHAVLEQLEKRRRSWYERVLREQQTEKEVMLARLVSYAEGKLREAQNEDVMAWLGRWAAAKIRWAEAKLLVQKAQEAALDLELSMRREQKRKIDTVVRSRRCVALMASQKRVDTEKERAWRAKRERKSRAQERKNPWKFVEFVENNWQFWQGGRDWRERLQGSLKRAKGSLKRALGR